jgi:hypothetical protein
MIREGSDFKMLMTIQHIQTIRFGLKRSCHGVCLHNGLIDYRVVLKGELDGVMALGACNTGDQQKEYCKVNPGGEVVGFLNEMSFGHHQIYTITLN